MFEGALAAFQFNRVATPMVAGMSDVSFMLVFAGIMAIYFPDIVIPTGETNTKEIVKAINVGVKAGYNKAEMERAVTGEATLDDSSGIRDAIGRLWFNITNPNWTFTDPNAPKPKPWDPSTWGEVFD